MVQQNKSKYINIIIPIIIVFVSTTGWYSLDYIGMKMFWAGFFILSFTYAFFILWNYKDNIKIKDIVTNKYNLLIGGYGLWLTISYLYNYQSRNTLLYVFKIWFMLGFYIVLTQIYIQNISKEEKRQLILNVSKYIFILGIFNSIVGLYQFTTLSNKIFGVIITDWYPYNPAAMYGNVNGFGTYLFISIICGATLFINNLNNNKNKYILFGLVFQGYMLYLTVARTSIVSLFGYFIFTLIILGIKNKNLLKNIFSTRNVIVFLVCNVIMFSIIKMPQYRGYINKLFKTTPSTESRTADELLKEKNSKGLNYRDLIWKAVARDYDEYILLGDGLKYNIIDKIDVVNVISERSKGVDRISYHNTLVRYFASNGMFGLVLFLALYFAIPLTLFINMMKRREIDIESSIVIILLAVIFMYMQMEEVYIGEIGFMPIIANMVLGYGSALLKKKQR
ncbi:O-antigen ligase family protein [Clostridium sp. MSJ-4]|uniref:O-antigen ligase family protein n=1 Tax=Clostridium simiarum TaxID=2841506 RepID=A0ABS6F1P7_9CLOT|nr:O-antigen ligase family protein [Clostridium simiarum]MBU5592425.1 O-antigen ligase family protein [Clostridium simiarum]